MIGRRKDNTELFQCITMEDLVPSNHLLRRLKNIVDLSFVRDKVADRYAKVGRASFDPEVIARMWILQHLYGYSERQVCDEVTMHAGYRFFCGLSFNDPVPDQSTLVKLRTQKWAQTDVWQALLDETVRAAEALGICRPDRFGVDGTQINANAATVSLEEIAPTLSMVETSVPSGAPDTDQPSAQETLNCQPQPAPTDAAAPSLTLEAGGRTHGKHKSGDPDWHGEKFSNATHRSTTDGDARLYRKGKNQEAKLRYLGHYLAHVKSGVIYGAMVTQATGTAEREATCALLDGLSIKPKELTADLGYRDGHFLADVIDRGVQPLVPIGHEPLEQVPVFARQNRNPDIIRDRLARIRAARARNQTRTASAGRRGVRAQRQRTRLEHLYAEAKDHHGLARAHGRGLERVDQQVKLTAAVQNLKRLLSARPKRRIGSEQSPLLPLLVPQAAVRRLQLFTPPP
jgi:transposase